MLVHKIFVLIVRLYFKDCFLISFQDILFTELYCFPLVVLEWVLGWILTAANSVLSFL